MSCFHQDSCKKLHDDIGNPYPHQSPCHYCTENIVDSAPRVLNDRAKYLKLSDEKQKRVDCIRTAFSGMYDIIEDICKPGRETSLALTRLEEAQFWAIKGITRENRENCRRTRSNAQLMSSSTN